MPQTRIALLILLSSLLVNQVALIGAHDGEANVLIICNSHDMRAAKAIIEFLESMGYNAEVSDRMKDGYRYYVILGGHKAEKIGSIASKYLSVEEKRALLIDKKYWTFSVTTSVKSIIINIAGSTRNETLRGTRILIESKILEFIFRKEGFSLEFGRVKSSSAFNWEFPPKSSLSRKYSLSIEIPEDLVEFFRIKPRMKIIEFQQNLSSPMFTWYLMMRTPHDDQFIAKLVKDLNRIADEEEISGCDRVWFISSFVQSMEYSRAYEFSRTGDYPSYPLETLSRGSGDCEDLSILLISLLKQAGFDSVLLIMPTHAAVAVSLPPEWVKFTRVRASVEEVNGVKVALVDLLDLWTKIKEQNLPLTLEIRLGNRSYFYTETTGFFRPGELPNLLLLAEELEWPYREFPIFIVSDDGAPVPLIYDYLTVTRKTESGYLVSILVKIRNSGESGVSGLRIESQIYPGSKLELGGVDPKIVRISDTVVTSLQTEINGSKVIESLDPNETAVYSFTFHTVSPVISARISLLLGSSEVDFLRLKAFEP